MNPMNFFMTPYGFNYFPIMPFLPNYPQENQVALFQSSGNAFSRALFSNFNDFTLQKSTQQATVQEQSQGILSPSIPHSPEEINFQQCQIQKHYPKSSEPIILSYKGESSPLIQKEVFPPVEMNCQGARRGVKSQKVGVEDQEYLPRVERKKKRSLKYQENQNRNIIPNEINQIFSFIQKKNKSGPILQRLLNKYPHPEEYTSKRFYLYQGLLKNKLGHYANQKSLKYLKELYEPKCENWPQREQVFYNKLCRILIYHFLVEDSVIIIATIRRMKQEKKRDHLHARRHVKEVVMRALSGL